MSDKSVPDQYFEAWEQEVGDDVIWKIASGPAGMRALVKMAFSAGYRAGIHYTSAFEPKKEEPFDER